MKKVTFRGFGQLNGSRMINLTIEVEDKTALDLHGPSRDSVKQAILSIHYPGVKINPKDVSVEIKAITSRIIDKKDKEDDILNIYSGVKAKNKFGRITIWSLIFFPLKISWRIVKFLWKTPHV